MAITIDYSDPAQYVINVPKADMTLVQSTPTEIRQLNIDDFRAILMDLQDDAAHSWAPTTHEHTAPFTVSGVTLARVVEILDPYVVQFEDGQYNVNIVGGNSNISDKVVKNQVGVNTANSAGLQDPFSLQAASFDSRVMINEGAAYSGTTFPYGTRTTPVNNLGDAKIIAAARGYDTLHIIGSCTLGPSDDVGGYRLVGDSPAAASVVFSGGGCASTELEDLSVSGAFGSDALLRVSRCIVGNVTNVAGEFIDSSLSGTLSLRSGQHASFANCADGIADTALPIVDVGSATGIMVWGYSGGLEVRNMAGPTQQVIIGVRSGEVVVAASVTAGTVVVRGVGTCQSLASVDVDTTALVSNASAASATWDEDLSLHSPAESAAAMIKRALGLSHENFYMDNTAYDANGQLTACRVRLFSSEADALAATDGGEPPPGGSDPQHIAEYDETSIWGTAPGELTTFRQVRTYPA